MHTSLKILFLAAIFLSGCKPQLKSKDFTEPGSFTQGIEGPAVDANGSIYAVNFKEEGTIGKVTPNGKSTTFVSLPDGSIGNGIRFGKNNTMFVADYTNHAILKIAMRLRSYPYSQKIQLQTNQMILQSHPMELFTQVIPIGKIIQGICGGLQRKRVLS
nr:hypothetical protein [Tenacibaculum sp. SG-28]